MGLKVYYNPACTHSTLQWEIARCPKCIAHTKQLEGWKTHPRLKASDEAIDAEELMRSPTAKSVTPKRKRGRPLKEWDTDLYAQIREMSLHQVLVWHTNQVHRAMGVITRHADMGMFDGKLFKTFTYCGRLYIVRIA